MEKPNLGKRYRCFGCGCAFYDLGKPKPICPRCGKNQSEAPKIEVPKEVTAILSRRRKETDLFLVDGIHLRDEDFVEIEDVGLEDDLDLIGEEE